MKHFFLFVLLASSSFAYSQKGWNNDVLSTKDVTLKDSISFNEYIFLKLRAKTNAAFTRFRNTIDEWNETTKQYETVEYSPDGLVFHESMVKTRLIVNLYLRDFRKRGYMIFISDENYGYSPDEITVIKTRDQFELLKIMGTNGVNYDLNTSDVIKKLKEWYERYPFEIIGCSFDGVEAQFSKQPEDMEKFAQEVYEFCPDVVDQGAGSVEELANEMKKANMLYLWWD